jgi:hypothetical protein
LSKELQAIFLPNLMLPVVLNVKPIIYKRKKQKYMSEVLEAIIAQIQQAKKDSLKNSVKTKRTGDYRIGLSKAESIVYDFLSCQNEKQDEINRLNATIDKLQTALSLQIDKNERIQTAVHSHLMTIENAKREKQEFANEKRKLVNKQISKLEAIKMLWAMMDNQSTHKNKSYFYRQALEVVNTEIEVLEKQNCQKNIKYNF